MYELLGLEIDTLMAQTKAESQEQLLHALRVARIEWLRAEAAIEKALAHRHDLEFQHPEGTHSLCQTERAYDCAFQKYRAALTSLNSFILDNIQSK